MVTEIRRTLPGVAYHSDETYALDTERVFYRNWVYVGRAERVAKPGAWLRVEIAGESILIVRGKDEQIRAFYNVCRHRGSRICDDEQGEVRTHLRCPYHAWGYALDGKLMGTPYFKGLDVPPELADEAVSRGRRQSDTPGHEPWPLAAWPDIETRFIVCRNDRFFPTPWLRGMVRDRLGIEPAEIDSGHCPALSRPQELARLLDRYATEAIES